MVQLKLKLSPHQLSKKNLQSQSGIVALPCNITGRLDKRMCRVVGLKLKRKEYTTQPYLPLPRSIRVYTQ